MSLDNLRKTRTSVKSAITRLESWLDSNKDKVLNSVEFEHRLTRVHELFSNYEKTQNDIELICTEENPDPEDRDFMENKYFKLISDYTKCINSLGNTQTYSSVKLPDIKIHSFSGEITEFESFYQLFDALIVKNASLSDIQKFIYLKSYLKGEPLQLIDSLPITNSNFPIALDVLKCRYENKFTIINSYLSAMLDSPNMTKCKPSSLCEFITTIQKNIQSLKNLKISHEELWNLVFIFLFQKKLDFNTKRAYETERDHSKLPDVNSFIKFLEKRCLILENIESSSPKPQRKIISAHPSTSQPKQSGKSFHSQNKITGSVCIYCSKSGHKIYSCFAFKNLQYQDKVKFIKLKNLCLNCFGKHMLQECTSSQTCSCAQKHNSLLHSNNSEIQHSQPRSGSNNIPSSSRVRELHNPSERNSNQNLSHSKIPSNNTVESHSSSQEDEENVHNSSQRFNALSHSALSVKNCYVLLATAKVILFSKTGQPIQARALLDTGTQTSLISERLVQKLHCNTYDVSLTITGISERATTSNKMTDVEICSNFDPRAKLHVSCAVLPNLTSKLPQNKIVVNKLDIPQEFVLADNTFYEPSEVDILLGLDCYYDLIGDGIIRLGESLPVLQETVFGWVVAGVLSNKYTLSYVNISHNAMVQTHFSVSCLSTSKVENFLKKFWEIEETPEKLLEKTLTKDEKLAEQIFTSTTKILENGRFQVDLPLKSPNEHKKLGESFSIAKKRFLTLENKFKKDKNLFSQYNDFIKEYVHLGHAQYVPLSLCNSNLENKYFIPHLCVIRESSISTKLRVVYDASCPSSSGLSLNNICLKGYQVHPDLYDILCRFRLFPYVFTTDIQKMYRQILVNPDQRFLQNILWRGNPNDDFKCIQLNTVTYGTNSAPFLATRVLNEIAVLHKKQFPLASEPILSQVYMDDALIGSYDLNSLLKLHSELSYLLEKYGFSLHKYCSNSETFLKNISKKSVTNSFEINLHDTPSKVLGLNWDSALDTLCVSVPENFNIFPVTKRKILSVIAQCYDPNGLINCVIVKGKILIQKLWLLKLEWDTVITDPDILSEFNSFIKDFPLLSQLKIPRFYFANKTILKIELHGFANASLSAYGSCVYFRAIYSDATISSTLVSSKSRIAPVKSLTLPRLEMCAMLILSKLVTKLVSIFENNNIKFDSVNLWTDSQVALCWCKGHASRWSVFVSHRVSQIQDLTENYVWRHVKSAENAADLVSRGIYPQEILKNELWWHGPKFLLNKNLDLSVADKPIFLLEIPEERKSHVATNVIKLEFWEQIFQKFSNLSRLQRSLAFMFRFLNNLRKNSENKISDGLSVRELEFSLHFIIKKIQQKHFAKELFELSSQNQLSNKQLLSLHPFLDDSGLLRVGGRLQNATIPFQQKHPLLLPAKDHVTRLILAYEHKRLGHAGAQTTLSNIRLRFWPLNGLREIKKIIRNCTTCFRLNSQVSQQIMASLPEDRVTVSRTFNKVGIDFGGPFLIKSSRLRKAPKIKVYIAVFVCMVTKAVHIETVTGLSTDSFILTLKRFIARRGNPSVIFSDNATNFSGAKNQLKELYDFFKNTTNSLCIKDFLSKNETSWKFIPPRSPHWGGIWESAIKSAKYHMRRLIGNANFTFEEFSTVLCQIEAILNSRPLSPLSNDAADLNCLSPGHFLIGSSLTAYPEKEVTHLPENRWRIADPCYENRFSNKNNGVRKFSDISDIEDLTEEAVVARHDKCEHEEKKRFLRFLKVPAGYGRNRTHKRTDSRAESSEANTPDPMSPHNTDLQESANSPMTSPPATPLPIQMDDGIPLPSIAVMRRRTMSQSKFHKEREWKEDNLNSVSDIAEVAPYEKRSFPIIDEVYEKMLKNMPENHQFATNSRSQDSSDQEEANLFDERLDSPDSESTESAIGDGEEDPNDPEWSDSERACKERYKR